MSAFLFAFLASLLAGVAARDQALIAGLSLRQGPRVAVLLTGIAVSFASAGLAAWAAEAMLPLMPPDGRRLFASMALALAGIECLAIMPRPVPAEPTRSLVAVGIVLLAQQIVDAARFLIFAIAIATSAPVPAGLGGAIGGALSLGLAWRAGGRMMDPRARLARRVVGSLLVVLGMALAAARLLG